MSAHVRLSAAPIDWGIAALVVGNPSPDEILDCIAEAGYAGCELGTHGYFGLASDDILRKFAKHGLAVSASWYDVDLAQPLRPEGAAEIDLICSFLQAGGATVINISSRILPERVAVIGQVPDHPETWWTDAEWAQVPGTLAEIEAITARRGVRVAVHPHVGTHIETADETRRFLDATVGMPIHFCLDTGHLMLGGGDPIDLLESDSHRVIHVHAKDVDGNQLARLRTGEIDYFGATGQGLYCDLGHGIVDWQGLRAGLDAHGYDGWVVAEQDRLLAPGSRVPFKANKRNHDFLADLFGLS